MKKVFQILVPDDKLVSRIISCENLVTELFVIDRADKDFVSEWEKELKKPALYILINRDTKELYVGETDNSYKRLKNHEAKDFWTEAIVFHSTTSTLSTTEVKWLEAKTFEELKMLDSYKLSHNKQTPKFPKLKKNQIYTLMPVFEEAKNYICAAGFDIFLRNVKRYSYEEETVENDNVQSPICKNDSGVTDRPYLSDQGKILIYFCSVKGKFIRETLKELGMPENIFDVTDLNELEKLRKVVAKKEKDQGRHNTNACSISQLKHYLEKGLTCKEFEHDAMIVKKQEKRKQMVKNNYSDIKPYVLPPEQSDMLQDAQIPIIYHDETRDMDGKLRVLSLFSGCGGMDLGFEGSFIAHRKSFPADSKYIEHIINDNWVMLKKTKFKTVFANDILKEAEVAWTTYMSRFGYTPEMYHNISIVDLVKMHNQGADIFPKDIDVVTGGFPCQDFSVAGKRKGFNSDKDDYGKKREGEEPSEETRGRLYYWMKQVIDIVKPKVFVAENVKGLVNLGDVKDIIQKDFASADGEGYIVLPPQVLHAGNYGVPEMRERVIFIGIRKDALKPEALKALSSQQVPREYDPYPIPTHSATVRGSNLMGIVTTQDVLEGLKEPENTIDASQQLYSKAKFLATGQGQTEIKLDNLGPTIRSEHHGNIEFRRLSLEHGGKHFDELNAGLQERRLTPRECALIQTFPPDYRFVMKKANGRGYRLSSSGAYKVIGNAVPPVLAFNIAMRLQEVWDEYFVPTD